MEVSINAKRAAPEGAAFLYFVVKLFEQLPQAAERQADDGVIVALDPFHELGRHSLKCIASGLVIPFRLVSVVCIPYTTTRFNQCLYMEYTPLPLSLTSYNTTPLHL